LQENSAAGPNSSDYQSFFATKSRFLTAAWAFFTVDDGDAGPV
jgi:hypothetical protein